MSAFGETVKEASSTLPNVAVAIQTIRAQSQMATL